MTLIRPVVQSVFGQRTQRIEKILMPVDKLLNRYLTDRYARRYAQAKTQPQQVSSDRVIA